MNSKSKHAKSRQTVKPISVAEFDAKFETGEDILKYLDLDAARVLNPGEQYLDLTPTKVNVDFPRWMVERLDSAASRVGVPRQSLIKMWLADRLQESEAKALPAR